MANERYINADEIEVRPCEVTDKSVRLLLYQDARRVLRIMDETYGPTNWQREYYPVNGLLFCKIGVRDDKGEWIWKADTGSSGGIEGEKSLASDAFKRAAVTWGIGRELYTAPRIVVDLNEKDYFNGKLCQNFHVGTIDVRNGTITKLTICDKWGKTRFNYEGTEKENNTITSENRPQKRAEGKIQMSNQDKLDVWYSDLKTDNSVDVSRLDGFYNFYSKSSKENPSISVADSMKFFDPQKRWEAWLNR